MATVQERMAALMAEMTTDELAAAKSAVSSKVSEVKAAQGKAAKETAAAAIREGVIDALSDGVLVDMVRRQMETPGLKKVVITILSDPDSAPSVNVPIGASNGSGERVMSYTRGKAEGRRLREGYVRLVKAVRDGNTAPFGVELTLADAVVAGHTVISGCGNVRTSHAAMVNTALESDDTNAFREGSHSDSMWRIIAGILKDAGADFSTARDLDVQLMAAVDEFAPTVDA